MAPRAERPPTISATYLSERSGEESTPDLRILHYNDVYHVDEASSEPVGGLARFITLCKEYKESPKFEGQPEPLVFFSGDAFNPSLESSVTKGRHMVPALNAIGTDCACVGNHDLDFGVKQFENLSSKTNFPWLLANVLDPALGENVPLGRAKRTHMLTTSTGIKVGIIGLGEREWLATINSLPPNLIYKSASETARDLVPELREQGAEIIVCISHMREPNDNKLAKQTDGIIDIILGGHDHYYSHSLINGTHVLRSGSDFKQLSYIEARRKTDGSNRWDFDIWRRDVTSEIAEHEPTVKLVNDLTSKLQKSLSRPVGWTAVPLDSRFDTVRTKESVIGNFVCDVMRQHHAADCAMIASGTVRGGQIYPPGAILVKDIVQCFPFEDPTVLLRVTGKAIRDALENSVSLYPALEGRFPQVSGIQFEFDPSREPGNRITSLEIAGDVADPERKYTLVTRGYMGRGKDGYTALLVKSEGGEAEEIIDEESGILLSTMLRQYFMGLRTVGRWTNLSDHWLSVATKCPGSLPASHSTSPDAPLRAPLTKAECKAVSSDPWERFINSRMGLNKAPINDDDSGSDSDEDENHLNEHERMELELLLMRKFFARWAIRARVKSCVSDSLKEGQYAVDWARTVAPALEGRIRMVGAHS